MTILVVGMGQSGYSAAESAMDLGHAVTACDRLTTDSLPVDVTPLLDRGLVFYGGSESEALLEGVDLLILSPGVPRTSPLVRGALAREIEVIGEMEWAYRNARGSIALVTGSNGKSTTTSLLGSIMAATLPDVRVGGNLGTPFSSLIAGSTEETWFVLEASSFQLESITTFRARVAVLLNLTPDHQDRYERFEDYQAAKGRAFLNQRPEDFAVFPAFDPLCVNQARGTRASKLVFSPEGELDRGAFVRAGEALWNQRGEEELLFPVEALGLPGVHNLGNALAAALAARCAGVPPGAITGPLSGFSGLAHRLEPAGTVGGASVYNDSKATNTDAVLKALTAFESGVILLLGGKDKGADWEALREEIGARCKAVVAFGAARGDVESAFAGLVTVKGFNSLEAATPAALAMAEPGDTVLLSPACASFDEFENFEDRGDRFKAWVKEAVEP